MKYSMLGLGDDNLLAIKIPKNMLNQLMSFMEKSISRTGLKPELKMQDFPSYCSAFFIPVQREVARQLHPTKLLMSSPGRLLVKMGWTAKNVSMRDYSAFLKGNALGNSNMWLVPILRVFYKHFSQLSVEAKTDKIIKITQKDCYPSNEIFEWMLARYNLSRLELLDCEAWLNGMLVKTHGKPNFYYHPVVARIVKIDCA